MGAMSEDPRRGFLDPPRWMNGGLASGAFALAGVAAGIACIVFLVLLLARKFAPTTGLLLGIVFGALCFLLLYLHRRAERYATVKGTDARMPRDRTVAFTIAREGNWVRQYIEGTTTGFAAVHDDHLFVRLSHYRTEFGLMWMSTVIFVRDPRLQLLAFLVVTSLELVNMFWKRDHRHSWSDIRSIVSSGKTLVVEFAAADGRKDLVLEITPKDREKILPLLRAHVPVEVLPEPPKPDRPKREPPPPRPPKPPNTAIDGETTASLDRALDGIRKLRP
jgi:hypothetical protein